MGSDPPERRDDVAEPPPESKTDEYHPADGHGEPSDGSFARELDGAFAAGRRNGHADSDPLIGQEKNGYRLGSIARQGGQSTVYLAHLEGNPFPKAVKVVKDDPNDPMLATRLQREAERTIIIQRECPDHIVQVHNVFRHEPTKTIWMPMEWLKGETVAERLRQIRETGGSGIQWQMAFRITIAVLRALEAAHRNGVIHRDISPSNIFLADKTKVIDFGLAEIYHVADQDRPRAFPAGTWVYKAPEGFERCEEDRRSDLYSTGVVLFEMLVGKPPFERLPDADERPFENFKHLQRAHQSAPIPDVYTPPSGNPLLPPSCGAVLERALAKEPENRFQNATEFRTALERALTAPNGRPTNGSAARPTGTRRRRWVAAGAAVVALAAAVIAVARFWSDKAPLPTREDQPLDGELTVYVWPKSRNQSDALDIRDPRAVPLSAGDLFRIEVTLNRPAYLYLLQIDSDGNLWPLFPWTDLRFETRGPESKRDKLKLPDDKDGEGQMAPIADGTTGLETFLLFASEEQLTDDRPLRDRFAKQPREGTAEFRGVFWLKNGVVVRDARDRKGRDRGPLQLTQSRPVDEALPETRALLRGEMRKLFPYSIGVVFPREKLAK
jgi:tRNA A-37 threonylcarbamoyl transferase component Bud32